MTNTDWVLIKLDNTDSTNNYAMQLVNDDKAHNGLTITARSQHSGKGQRGRKWTDMPDKCLLMSVVVNPKMPISAQFTFSAAMATAIANILQKSLPECQVRIKWPNDIIINDKKAGGILIENALRGSNWTHSVIGVGLNVLQSSFPKDLPDATSLKMASGKSFEIDEIRDMLRGELIRVAASGNVNPGLILEQYNEVLYKKDQLQLFGKDDNTWMARVVRAHEDGTLEVLTEDGMVAFYIHGNVKWIF